MKIAINKQDKNICEVGYYEGNKLNYYLMESQEALKYIKKKEPLAVISNNIILKLNNEKNYRLDKMTLRMISATKKFKIDNFLFLEINERVSFFLFKNKKIVKLKSKNFFTSSKLECDQVETYTDLYQTYLKYSGLYDSVLANKQLSFENIYLGCLINDYVSKIVLRKFFVEVKRDLNKYKEKHRLNQLVLATELNDIITKEALELFLEIEIKLEKISKRDNLRTILDIYEKK